MSVYSRYVFPWLMDLVMSGRRHAELRPGVLRDARGDVLEVGFGTGLNLAHYPEHVGRLTILEPNPGMRRFWPRRFAASQVEVEEIPATPGGAAALPSEAFDTVVCTWTLCSVQDALAFLGDIHRALRTGGKLLFIEHGLSPESRVARWQRRLNGINRRLGAGCNLNRDIGALLRASPLSVERLETFYIPRMPRIGGYQYAGVAVKR